MRCFDALVEERIRGAIERGELDDLPGAGAPLRLDDDTFVPEELRLAYRVLKNAGFLPPEVEIRREIASLRALVAACDGADRLAARSRAEALQARLDAARRGGVRYDARYAVSVVERSVSRS